MKKALLAVFSVSITAGTVYLAYSQGKSYYIKKLVESWIKESAKRSTHLSVEQIAELPEELEKLNLWEIKQLYNYSQRVIAKAPETELAPMLKKLMDKKIPFKANLRAIETVFFGDQTLVKPIKQ